MKSVLLFIAGIVFCFITMTTYLAHQYGRMANHQHCDLSLEQLGSIENSNYYYHTYHR
jgi:hypothetical protein